MVLLKIYSNKGLQASTARRVLAVAITVLVVSSIVNFSANMVYSLEDIMTIGPNPVAEPVFLGLDITMSVCARINVSIFVCFCSNSQYFHSTF